MKPARLLSLREVAAEWGLAIGMLNRLRRKDPDFPKPSTLLDGRKKLFWSNELEAYFKSLKRNKGSE